MLTRDIPLNRLYHELAYLWPLLSPPGDYAEEALHWRRILRQALGPGRHAILDLGVGGGHNLSHLTGEFEATAIDRSAEMLDLSRQLNPGVHHVIGDMRTVRLNRTFKAVLIHDAISHITTEDDLRTVFQSAALHLDPGGIVIAAPDWLRETFHSPWTAEIQGGDAHLRLTTFEYVHDPDPHDTTIETVMIHVIEEDGKTRIEPDRLILGLFPTSTWRQAIESAGLIFGQHPAFLKSAGVDYQLMSGRKPKAALRGAATGIRKRMKRTQP